MEPKVILDTALHREEISAIEALMLLQDKNACGNELLEVANILNQRLNNNVVTYVRSRQIHYTNICRADCKFCSFYRKKSQKRTFTLTVSEIIRSIREAGAIRQVVLSGGLNPDLTLPQHVEIVRTIRNEFPNLHIHGYSPAEIHFAARRARTTPYDVLRRLQNAGLDSLSGDSAEILNDKIRKKICPDKLRTADWIDVIRTAHRLGLPTTATMLFGHIEDEIHICEHLEIIKNIQRETGGIVAFEPVPFVPKETALAREKKVKSMTPMENVLRIFAISRVFFGRLIKNIQVDWSKIGLANSVRCLEAGANDLGGLAVDPFEILGPEVNGALALDPAAVRQAIQRAGRVPLQRDPYSARTLPYPRTRKEEPVLV